jgi:hypothetical protein
MNTATTLHPRRAAAAFRFDTGRDDLAPAAETVRVFTTSSPLLDGCNCGVYGAPVVVLTGWAKVEGANGLNSVKAVDGLAGYTVGRAVELTLPELARLDRVAELAGNYHRFLTTVRSPMNGWEVEAWVYQLLEDSSEIEMATSAITEAEVETATGIY